MHPNEALLRGAYDAQARGDLDGYLALLSDDFVLHIPGESRIAGDYRGREEMRRHFQEIAQLSGGTFRTAIHDVLASDEHVIGLVAASADHEGRRVDLHRVHVWHVRHGRLAELWLHPTDQRAFDAYWGDVDR
ncbi:MAG TPA: nuclear transport factor 2 family protein [Actinomycetota bacterium]